jgi:hypothetical protein
MALTNARRDFFYGKNIDVQFFLSNQLVPHRSIEVVNWKPATAKPCIAALEVARPQKHS